jgi:DNA-binding CsgD family transcriptional regulator
MIEMRRGNLPDAEDYAHTSLYLLSNRAWGVAIGKPLSSLLLTAVASSRYENAASYLRIPVPETMFETPYGLLYLYARGEYYLATGRPQAALADFKACGDRMVMWELDRPGLVPWRSKAAEAHLAMANSDTARVLAEEQLAKIGSRPSRTRGISLRVLAQTSPPERRIALLRESAEVLRESGARLELAYTLTELGNAHLALGERDRASRAARQARDLAARCGVKSAEKVIDASDGDQRKWANNADGRQLSQLSNAERRVATLAACGYTNCQISKRLYITVSTVEQHLTRVYRKLGVTGRAGLPVVI